MDYSTLDTEVSVSHNSRRMQSFALSYRITFKQSSSDESVWFASLRSLTFCFCTLHSEDRRKHRRITRWLTKRFYNGTAQLISFHRLNSSQQFFMTWLKMVIHFLRVRICTLCSELDVDQVRLLECSRMTVNVKQPLLRKSHALSTHGEGAPTKSEEGESRTSRTGLTDLWWSLQGRWINIDFKPTAAGVQCLRPCAIRNLWRKSLLIASEFLFLQKDIWNE